MAQYVTKIRTESGDKQIDYNYLANLPKPDATLTQAGSFADAKAVSDAIKTAKSDLTTQINNTKTEVTSQINTTKEELTAQINTTNNQITNITNNVTNLTAADVHALPDTYVPPVTSVNGQTGEVTIKVGVAGASEGHLPVFNASGDIVSSGKSLWEFTRATMSLDGTTLTITTVE